MERIASSEVIFGSLHRHRLVCNADQKSFSEDDLGDLKTWAEIRLYQHQTNKQQKQLEKVFIQQEKFCVLQKKKEGSCRLKLITELSWRHRKDCSRCLGIRSPTFCGPINTKRQEGPFIISMTSGLDGLGEDSIYKELFIRDASISSGREIDFVNLEGYSE
ncbi:hypothetical protein CEXT_201271 [Caerostris extrusa]|uniref:Uncharacterized protein n=1 Tax=Caerostris extrusa TaxID=172846 RepID=A0AAV4MC55_CAEEX|nr:hypothetical protein CEXT_201271 [Caerostris extrusa]